MEADMTSCPDPGDLGKLLEQAFSLPRLDVRTCSTLSLAFVGDAAYELVVRTILLRRGDVSVEQLDERKRKVVSAGAQAVFALAIEPLLTQEEREVYRRGRNAQPRHLAKHASRQEYSRATGLETLYGFLYLTGNFQRLTELIAESFKLTQMSI